MHNLRISWKLITLVWSFCDLEYCLWIYPWFIKNNEDGHTLVIPSNLHHNKEYYFTLYFILFNLRIRVEHLLIFFYLRYISKKYGTSASFFRYSCSSILPLLIVRTKFCDNIVIIASGRKDMAQSYKKSKNWKYFQSNIKKRTGGYLSLGVLGHYPKHSCILKRADCLEQGGVCMVENVLKKDRLNVIKNKHLENVEGSWVKY